MLLETRIAGTVSKVSVLNIELYSSIVLAGIGSFSFWEPTTLKQQWCHWAAEYQAAIVAIQIAKEHNIRHLRIVTDSEYLKNCAEVVREKVRRKLKRKDDIDVNESLTGQCHEIFYPRFFSH
jgi:hypothetical protein